MGNAIRMGENIRGRRRLLAGVEEEEATSSGSSSHHLRPLLSSHSHQPTSYPHAVLYYTSILLHHPDPIIPTTPPPPLCCQPATATTSCKHQRPPLPARISSPTTASQPTDRQTDNAPIAFLTSPPPPKQASRYHTQSHVHPPLPPNRPPGLPLCWLLQRVD